MKRFFVFLTLIFTIFIFTNAFAKTDFTDDKDIQSYSRPYVEMLVSEGGIHGYTDNSFKPKCTVSKAEFLSMCINSLGTDKIDTALKSIGQEEYVEIVKSYDFRQVWNGAANDMLIAAYVTGISDYSGGQLNSAITRAEAAKMLYLSLLNLKEENIEISSDTSLISDWNIIKDSEYAEGIGTLFALGIVQGDSKGYFNPQSTLTREDSAILICKALKPELREVRTVTEAEKAETPIGESGIRTIENLIKTAFEPVGKVMYIYGGGWNEADDGAGVEAMTLGLSQSWLDFTSKQNSSYNYQNYDYKKNVNVIHDGLDCSGYVGWVIYNVFNDGKGYVTNSYKMDDMLANLGYGTITPRSSITEVKAGDIMASGCNDCKHVYISLGKCSDGSMLLLHSSPPGVQLSGTYTPSGSKNSEAIKLAEEYMKKYYPDWYNKFPDSSRNASYLTHYDRFEWSVLSDDEGIRNMSPREILEYIFNE